MPPPRPLLPSLLLPAAVLALSPPPPPTPDPAAIAVAVGDRMLKELIPLSQVWSYGGALIRDGLFRAAARFDVGRWADSVSDNIDRFLTDPLARGYRIVHNDTLAWDTSVGDRTGLFPITYLRRAQYFRTRRPAYDNATDLFVARATADRYILGWPHRLADGTFTRTVGSWPGESSGPGGTIMWGDDQTMGTLLVARLAAEVRDPRYTAEVVRQQLGFAARLRDEADGLYYHAYNAADGHPSCCKWGRANGWALLGHVEALDSFAAYPGTSTADERSMVLTIFRLQAAAMRSVQSEDGRWHQLVNDSSSGSFLETSVTAMAVSALARGVLRGYLQQGDYDTAVRRGWAGLSSAVDADGVVLGVCGGTDIQPTAAKYYTRPTEYLGSAPGGVGIVLYAAVDYADYVARFGNGTA